VKIIFRTKFGSHLYGTDTPLSDLDFKGVFLPDAKDILLQRVKGSLGDKKSKVEGEKNSSEDVDDESYSLQRYLGLLAEGQTVAIDMLFAPTPEIDTCLWNNIKFHKDKVLTSKSKAFVGYCFQQSSKYGIKGSRVAAAKKAMEYFTDAVNFHGNSCKVGDVVLSGDRTIDEFTKVLTKETTQGKFETYFECCGRMVGFKNTLKEAAGVFTRIYENYGDRARRAENNEGIDWKALSHAVRVGNEAVELLTTANVTFPLQNREHILEIKKGLLPYDQVAEEIEQLLVEVEEASKVSVLRNEPDYEWINDLVEEVYAEIVCDEYRTNSYGF